MRRFLLPLALVTVAFAGCLEDDGAPQDEVPDAEEPRALEPRDIDRGQQSGVEVATQELVADDERWADLWAQHVQHQEPGREAPVIDFDQERVIAVVLGERPNGCWQIQIGDVVEDVGGIEAEVLVYRPGEGVACPDVIVRPYHFVAVESRALHAGFVERETAVGPEGATGPPPAVEGEMLEVRTLAEGQNSGLNEERREWFADEEAWHAFWSEHARTQVPQPEPPEVDFGQERVIAVALPVKTSGGYDVSIDRVVWREGSLSVEYSWRAPAEGEFVTSVMTQPFHFVAVPLALEPDQVVFIEDGPDTY